MRGVRDGTYPHRTAGLMWRCNISRDLRQGFLVPACISWYFAIAANYH